MTRSRPVRWMREAGRAAAGGQAMNPATPLAGLYARLLSIDGEAPATVAGELRAEAAADPRAFAAFLADLPLDDDCRLFEIHEALFADEATHAEVLAAEFVRLFAAAARDPHHPAIYRQLAAIGFARTPALTGQVESLLLDALTSAHAPLRRFAADQAGDWLPSSDGRLEGALAHRCAHDPDWRVRVLAHRSLASLAVPVAGRLRLMDRLRQWMPGLRVDHYTD